MTIRFGGRRVVVASPDGRERGRLGVEMAAAFAAAHAQGAAVCFLRPRELDDDPVFSLTSDVVPVLHPRGAAGARAWLAATARRAEERARARAAAARSGFWLEWYRELRRHAGDQRLPLDLRGELRRAAHRSFDRAAAADRRRGGARFPRERLRDAVAVRLPGPLLERARAEVRRLGLPDGPIVALDLRGHVDGRESCLAVLTQAGLAPIDLGISALVDLYLLLTSAFLVCDNPDAQRFAYLTGTPTLLINATDAVGEYPVRNGGVYLLKEAVDLDTGRVLPLDERLTESYYRNLRNYGFRSNDAGSVRAAVEEMVHGTRDGWRDTAGQARFRELASATAALAERWRHLWKWGAVNGFIGAGRLARVQAGTLGGL